MNYNDPKSDSTSKKRPSNAQVFEDFKKEGLNTGDSTPKPTVNKGGSLSGVASTAKKLAGYAVFGSIGGVDPIVNAGKKVMNYISDKYKSLEDFQATKQKISRGGSGAPTNYKQEPGKAPMLRNCGSSRYKK